MPNCRPDRNGNWAPMEGVKFTLRFFFSNTVLPDSFEVVKYDGLDVTVYDTSTLECVIMHTSAQCAPTIFLFESKYDPIEEHQSMSQDHGMISHSADMSTVSPRTDRMARRSR
jgi:hypothetical protein